MSKIGFLTSYDESTASAYNVAVEVLPNDSDNLLSEYATRENFLQLLRKFPQHDVFVFSHGNSDKFYDSKDSPAYSIEDKLFADRKVFVYACYTANILGKKSSNDNCIYWGFTGWIIPFEDNILCKHIFTKIISDILMKYSEKDTEDKINEYLKKIRSLCDEGENELAELYEIHPEFDFIDAYSSLNHIWSRLWVYFKSEYNVLRHPDANPNPLFETYTTY